MGKIELPWATGAWRAEAARYVSDIDRLLAEVGLNRDDVGSGTEGDRAARNFAVRVPPAVIDRIRKGDGKDPVLRQVLPVDAEERATPGFVADPLGEGILTENGGLIRKYRGRALIVVTGACAVHCRYCFRRHFPFTVDADPLRAIDAVAADESIREVILSGGDPLMLGDERLQELLGRIEAIAHVRRIRIHTRMPVVLPERIDGGLLAVVSDLDRPPVVVVHVNHARELGRKARTALTALAEEGVALFNQSVLLAGVNDDVDVLAELSDELFDCRVVPYYLHLLDRVDGAAHFEVPEERAVALIEQLAARLPGYLVPRLVREIEGAPFKVPAGAS